MKIDLSLLSDADKAWLEEKVMLPIVCALIGIKDAIGSQEEMLSALKAMQARVEQIEPQTKG